MIIYNNIRLYKGLWFGCAILFYHTTKTAFLVAQKVFTSVRRRLISKYFFLFCIAKVPIGQLREPQSNGGLASNSAARSCGSTWRARRTARFPRIWTDWYADRLDGNIRDDEDELAIVQIEDALWDQGPAAVNAEIAMHVNGRRSANIEKLAS